MAKAWLATGGAKVLVSATGKPLVCDDCPCGCTCACGADEFDVPTVTVGSGLFVSFVPTDILSSNPTFTCLGNVCVWSGSIEQVYYDGSNDFSENIYATFVLNPDKSWTLTITGEARYLHPAYPFSYERTGSLGESCAPISIGPEGIYFDYGPGAIGPFDLTLGFAP